MSAPEGCIDAKTLRLTRNGVTYVLGTALSFIRVCRVCGEERFRCEAHNPYEYCWQGHGEMDTLTTANLERYKALWARVDAHPVLQREKFNPSNEWVLAFTVIDQPRAPEPADWVPYFWEVCECGKRGHVILAARSHAQTRAFAEPAGRPTPSADGCQSDQKPG